MTNVEGLSDLLKPFNARVMRAYPVSGRINQVANDDEACSAPVEIAPAQTGLFWMAKATKKRSAPATQPEILKGWKEIAAFLGHPTAVVQRWASDGMPVRRQGRFVTTTPEELNNWLGKQSGKPVRIATESTDLAAEMKRGLSFVRKQKRDK
jgi:hypothetical protein